MSISLNTHREDQLLELSDLEPTSLSLNIRSGTFTGLGDFHHVDTSWLKDFVENLKTISKNPGVAVLVDLDGNELRFQTDHLTVSGRIIEPARNRQELQFSFETDQTCLPPFITALSSELT